MKNSFLLPTKKILLVSCLSAVFFACKKDRPQTPPSDAMLLNVSKVDYQWGELAINKKNMSDVVQYDAATGKIDSVISYNALKDSTERIGFSYDGTNLSLNTKLKDKYKLDNQGRVIYHSTEEIQHGNNIVSIENFSYDANGYLNKVLMSSNFNDYKGPVFSVITYEVNNGNYIKYALSNVDGGTVTRQYIFNYNSAVKVKSAVSVFAPIFAGNTTSNVDKYLNYGKGSTNLITGVDYYLTNLDNTTTKGSFSVYTQINDEHYLTELTLNGATLTAFPSDNISPLPRSMKLTLKR